MTLAVPSALEYVGPAVELIAGQAPASLSPRRVRFNLRTALAEALANAIAYGNRHDTSRLVRVRVEADRHGVRIHVRDHGAGVGVDGPFAAEPDGGRDGGHVETPEGRAWFEPVPGMDGVWLEIGGKRRRGKREGPPLPTAGELAEIVGSLLAAERETAHVAAELSERYEEIDLIYTISDILGHTIRLDEAAGPILRDVSPVVGARRATLLVLDEERRGLRPLAARGVGPQAAGPIQGGDPSSVAAPPFPAGRRVSS